MNKEKIYGLRDQLSKFLYDPTPDQAAWRDKMWEEGRFDESIKITKQVEEQLDYVEEQIAVIEAAEPSIGEKFTTNVTLNLPWLKGLRGTGIGSLLGLAKTAGEEIGEVEAQRLKEIEQLFLLMRLQEGGQEEGIMSLTDKTPKMGEKVETKTLYHRGPKGIDKLELRTDKFGWEKNALFFLNKPQKSGYGDVLYKVEANISPESSIKLGNPPKELIKNLDAEIAQSTEPNAKEELTELRGVLHGNRWFGGTSESRELMREQGQVRSLTSRQSEFLLNQGIKHLEGLDERYLPKFLQNATSIVLDPDILNIIEVDGVPRNVLKKTKGYKSGGLIMNYGDYGRSYN